MQKEHRLRRRGDFRRTFRRGTSVANRQFVIYRSVRRDAGPVRIGVSVRKKVGNAVTRNRIKRLVKEIMRSWVNQLPEGTDIVLIARKPAADMDYHQMKSSLRHVAKKARLFQKRPEGPKTDSREGGSQ